MNRITYIDYAKSIAMFYFELIFTMLYMLTAKPHNTITCDNSNYIVACL